MAALTGHGGTTKYTLELFILQYPFIGIQYLEKEHENRVNGCIVTSRGVVDETVGKSETV